MIFLPGNRRRKKGPTPIEDDFCRMVQKTFGQQYDCLDSFIGHILPKNVTQSSYAIGHLISTDISGLQMLLLLLKELVCKPGALLEDHKASVYHIAQNMIPVQQVGSFCA